MILGRQSIRSLIGLKYIKDLWQGLKVRKSSSNCDEFCFTPIKAEQYQKYSSMMLEHFLGREPLNLGLHLTPEEGKGMIIEGIKEWSNSGASLEVIHTPSGALAGTLFCKILTKDDRNTFQEADENHCSEKMRYLLTILYHLEQSFDPFKDPNVTKVLELVTLAVDKKFSGKNLSYRLIKEGENLATLNGCQIATSLLTNKTTQHIFKKLGYKVVYTLDYGSFKIDGKKILDVNAMEGTTIAQVVTKKLIKE